MMGPLYGRGCSLVYPQAIFVRSKDLTKGGEKRGRATNLRSRRTMSWSCRYFTPDNTELGEKSTEHWFLVLHAGREGT